MSFALEIANRDWIVKNFQPQAFSRYDNMILLEDRTLEAKTSRARTTWTYLVQKDENFVLEKQVAIDTRLWSLHGLIDIFEKAGWRFKTVYPGLGRQQGDVPLTELQRLFFTVVKPAPRKKLIE
jgi:hypothetical protein